MKCPDCDFVCSDLRDICPKCLVDLRDFKAQIGLPVSNPRASYEQLAERTARGPGSGAFFARSAEIATTRSIRSFLSGLFFKSRDRRESPPKEPSPALSPVEGSTVDASTVDGAAMSDAAEVEEADLRDSDHLTPEYEAPQSNQSQLPNPLSEDLDYSAPESLHQPTNTAQAEPLMQTVTEISLPPSATISSGHQSDIDSSHIHSSEMESASPPDTGMPVISHAEDSISERSFPLDTSGQIPHAHELPVDAASEETELAPTDGQESGIHATEELRAHSEDSSWSSNIFETPPLEPSPVQTHPIEASSIDANIPLAPSDFVSDPDFAPHKTLEPSTPLKDSVEYVSVASTAEEALSNQEEIRPSLDSGAFPPSSSTPSATHGEESELPPLSPTVLLEASEMHAFPFDTEQVAPDIEHLFAEALQSLTESTPSQDLELSAADFFTMEGRADVEVLFEMAREALLDPESERRYVDSVDTSVNRRIDAGDAVAQLKIVERITSAPMITLRGASGLSLSGRSIEPETTPDAALPRGSLWKRSAAFVLDVLVSLVFGLGVTSTVFLLGPVSINELVTGTIVLNEFDLIDLSTWFCLGTLLGLVVVPLCSLAWKSRTPGQAAFGLSVKSPRGRPLGLAQSVVWSLTAPLSLVMGGTSPLLVGRVSLHEWAAKALIVASQPEALSTEKS